MRNPLLRNLVNPWVLLAVLGVAALLTMITLAIVQSRRPGTVPNPPVTAALTVIPAPTATPLGVTATSESEPSPTLQASPTLVPGTLAIGAYVQIAGTGGDGLRLRTDPGLDSQVRFLGLEAEVFQIRDGPRQSNDYTWWYLVAPFDETRSGWSVSEYLVVIQNP